MAMGKAVVATEIGQLKSIVTHGETGLLVPPGNLDHFVQAIRLLGEDKEMRESMGRRAAKEAYTQHTWKRRAETFMEEACRELFSNKEKELSL